ncbi:hypothetical protein F7Q92_05840 [Ideonella dechloratans]|uniref:Uncharacterized protein n=1 Tax=Ideonella dechloratans TaxID=36863 RepID=A0A643FHG2_IDEDE|nr:hypothetical protein [Ideonella dechloratans]KAB0583989.1 hypothetical protein F7Q92_05840 [Ideonella dechloratans]UFU12523.1 hypothetical protein LRM40_19255 [Ideonella dechloratans]
MNTAFTASTASTRAGLLGLAFVTCLSLLGGVSRIADHQVRDVQLAQAAATPMALADTTEVPVQVIHIVGKRIANT